MSDAKKCDLCEALYEVQTGNVSIDIDVALKLNADEEPGDRKWQPWTEVDFCAACSKKVLALIGKALQGLER